MHANKAARDAFEMKWIENKEKKAEVEREGQRKRQ